MSHRKYEAPRHGSLGFLPKKRCRRGQGRVKAFPKDDVKQAPHLTAFMGFKAGMTHVSRETEKSGSGSKLTKDVIEACTVIDCPEMIVVGLVGYRETPMGLMAVTTVWTNFLSEDVKKRFYKRWFLSRKDAFTKYVANYSQENVDASLKKLIKSSKVIRVIAHSQPALTPTGQKRAHLMEIQINGGSIEDKVKFGHGLFEQPINVGSVFKVEENIDCIGITKGKGRTGVIKRWGVTRLPRKTHRGLRKVACIGAWHPARVQFQVARAGQLGFHHRTQVHKKIYRVGVKGDPASGSTHSDISQKTITPLGGFPHYGSISNDFLLIKGCILGPRRRAITLRKTLNPPTTRKALEKVNLKFIDTSSKIGHGKFQTMDEKNAFFGPMKSRPSTLPKAD